MLRVVWVFGAIFFLAAVAVQYNDPDPFVWMALYGIVALANLGALGHCLTPRLLAIATVPHIVIALWLSPNLLRTSASAFGTIGMKNDLDEAVREVWGALICIAWMLGLYLHARRLAHRKRLEALV